MITRFLTLSTQNSYILLGPRLTGKSYYIRTLKDATFWEVNLLLSQTFLKYERNPSQFRKEALYKIKNDHIRTIFIDEIQKLPILLNEVHQLIEETACKFILTGSSARKLMRGSANLLGGRALLKQLFPFTFPEISSYYESHPLDELLQFGVLPGIFVKKPESRPEILRSYVRTYLKEEIQAEGLVRKLSHFSQFLDVAAQSFAETLNYSKIGRDCDQSPKTTQNYYEILDDTLIGFRLYCWTESKRKQLSTQPKFYFFDNGVTCALLSRLIDPLDFTLRGKLFEQWIINELRARFHYESLDLELFTWRTVSGEEVDLLVARGKKLLFGVEIKSFSKLNPEHFRGLKALESEYPGLPLYLVYAGDQPYEEGMVKVLPWKMFLSQIKELG